MERMVMMLLLLLLLLLMRLMLLLLLLLLMLLMLLMLLLMLMLMLLLLLLMLMLRAGGGSFFGDECFCSSIMVESYDGGSLADPFPLPLPLFALPLPLFSPCGCAGDDGPPLTVAPPADDVAGCCWRPGRDCFARSGCFGTPTADDALVGCCCLDGPSCPRAEGDGGGGWAAYPEPAALFSLCCTETAYDGGGGLLCRSIDCSGWPPAGAGGATAVCRIGFCTCVDLTECMMIGCCAAFDEGGWAPDGFGCSGIGRWMELPTPPPPPPPPTVLPCETVIGLDEPIDAFE
uniref:Uncharacterized protein n=1 Tax=Anopheles atroparvus TaxID=41427 RepID=A0A182JDE8_ANOAO